jgi:NAD(P)H-hydrate epimerase
MSTRSMSRDEVRAIDRRAIEELGLPGIVLMENAGRGATDVLVSLGIAGTVLICAGKGNNAGDGFVIARHLEIRSVPVRVLLFCDPDQLQGDAAIAYGVLEKSGTPIHCLQTPIDTAQLDQELAEADWIVDALLGTGIKNEVREPFATVIERINAANRKVLAIDLPSGLDCDSGKPLGCCIHADHTVTFVARKIGFDVSDSEEWTGQVHVVDIGVPRLLLEPLRSHRK